jgi:pimeloyl-ACP methyl ester carboxylesterase
MRRFKSRWGGNTVERAKTLKTDVWDPDERSGLATDGDIIERFVSVPLDPGGRDQRRFDLYYLVHTPPEGRGSKTVLFCSGGPGEIVRGSGVDRTYADFLTKHDYNVVIFHIRGSGFSQLPPSQEYDKYLKALYAVEDMEAIRREFLREQPWDAIIAMSYGTVLAQRYAANPRYQRMVKKLILVSPLSRHFFNYHADPVEAFDRYYRAMLQIYRHSLRKIYGSKRELFQTEFGDMSGPQIERIVAELFGVEDDPNTKGIFHKAEDAFGSIQFIIDSYCEIRDELKQYGLDHFSEMFFKKLRDLRFFGSNSIDDGTDQNQRLIGKVLRDELTGQRAVIAAPRQSRLYNQGYQRAYYGFGVHDGINWRFLRDWLAAGKKDTRASLRAIGGLVNASGAANKWLEKLKVDERELKPWDPAEFPHSVPTLVLNGEADPVTAAGQAEHFFSSALRGPRTLITFPGVGHQISLSAVQKPYSDDATDRAPSPLLSGAIRVDPPLIPPGEVRALNAVATGRRFDTKLHMEMKPPPNLAPLKVHGCCILERQVPKNGDQGTENIAVLIENKTNRSFRIKGSRWTKNTDYFWGTVELAYPDKIMPGRTELACGTLIQGGKNKDREIHVKPQGDVEAGLELVGFNVSPPSEVQMWIRNNSDRPSAKATTNWVIYNGAGLRSAFKVTVPALEPQKIISVPVGVDGLQIEENEIITIKKPENLEGEACLGAQEQGHNRVPFVLWNPKESAINVKRGRWELHTPAFSVTVEMNPVKIPAGTVRTTYATITGIRWHQWIDIQPPADLEPELELVGFNILKENRICLLLKNNGKGSQNGAVREWIYVDPNEDANITELIETLNCLIYSFLLLGSERFRNEEDNQILKKIRQKFKNVGLNVNIEHGDVKKGLYSRYDAESARSLTILKALRYQRSNLSKQRSQLMTISGQSLTPSEKAKLDKLRKSKSERQKKNMDKTLSKIVQDAIKVAGVTEAQNIKDAIARKLRQTFELD